MQGWRPCVVMTHILWRLSATGLTTARVSSGQPVGLDQSGAAAEWPYSGRMWTFVHAVLHLDVGSLIESVVWPFSDVIFSVFNDLPATFRLLSTQQQAYVYVVAYTVAIYIAYRWVWRYIFDSYFSSLAPQLFKKLENPLCTRCRPELRKFEMPNSIAEAKFVAPTRCQMCCRVPGWYDLEECVVRIDNDAHQCLINFTELKLVKDVRDVHGPFINTIDARPTQNFNLHLFQTMLPKIINLQDRYTSFWSFDMLSWWTGVIRGVDIEKWTNSIKYCGTFKEITSDNCTSDDEDCTPSSRGNLDRLRRIWDFVTLHGTYPVTTVVAGPRAVLNRLIGGSRRRAEARRLDQDADRAANYMSTHAIILEVQAEITSAASTGPGETSAFVPHEAAFVTGPIVVPSTLADPAHVSHGVEQRTQVKDDPRTGKPLFYDKKSHTATIHARFWNRILDELLDREKVLKILSNTMGDKQLGEYGLSKFGKDVIGDAVDINQMVRSPEMIKMRVAHGKWEGIDKDGKTVRSVIDNGKELLTMVHVFGTVFTEAIFGEKSPFYKMNIKHQDRVDCLNQFVKLNAGDFGEPMIMFEVDQTNCEAHLRAPGSLEPVLRAMQKVANICCQNFSGQLGSRYSAKIGYDIEKGMRISIEIAGVAVPGSKKKAVLKFPDFYLDSGWMLTSAANFISELTLTMSTFVEDPWHIFAWNEGTQKYRINEAKPGEKSQTFDYTYTSRPFPRANGEAWIPLRIIWLGLFEGDDGGGGVSRSICGKSTDAEIGAVKTQLTYYMADVGMSAKFVLVINGRVEIIGAHMLAVNGRLDLTFPWCPAIKRYLGKIGVAAQTRQPTTVEGRTILAASRMISIASMFRGNIEKLHDAFTNLANFHYKKLSQFSKLKQYRVEIYSAEEQAGMEAGITCLQTTFATMEAKGAVAKYPVQSTQELMILNSLQLTKPGHNVLSKLDIWSQDLKHWDGDHEAYYRQLPDIFK